AAQAAVGSAGATARAARSGGPARSPVRRGRGSERVRAGGPCSAAAPALAPAAGDRPGRAAGGPAAAGSRDGRVMAGRAVLELPAGATVVLDGGEWTVERREPHLGRVHLIGGDGSRQQVSIRFLANHPGCWPSSRAEVPAVGLGRQPKTVEDLKPGRREMAELRMEHLLEVATGFRSGDRLRPGPGEPRPEYDPYTTTLTARRRAKVAELKAMDRQQARLLGLDAVSYHTLIRWEDGRRRFGLVGCADNRWLREGGGHPAVTEEVREAIFAVREETLRRARV